MVDDVIDLRRLLEANTIIICESGYTKPLANATLRDRDELLRTVFLHQTIFRSIAELEQLRGGLNVLGVCDEMARSPDTLLEFFTSACIKPLTAGLMYIHRSYTIIIVADYVQISGRMMRH